MIFNSTIVKQIALRYCDILFFLCVILLIIMRYEGLFYPYFWDEMDVYAQGALYLFDHQPSLFPQDLPPELSRGHPLLYYFLSATIFKIFGPKVIVAHIFSLSVSLIFISSIYLIAKKMFSPQIAIGSLLIAFFQPVFIAQSILLLPEVFLALLTLLSLFAYLSSKHLAYLFLSSLGVLTKETGVVLPMVIIIFAYTPILRNLQPIGLNLSKIFYFTPIFVYIVFLVVQRFQNGWFIFPYHASLISFNPISFIKNFFIALYFFCIAQGRLVLSMGLILMIFIKWRALIALSQNRSNYPHTGRRLLFFLLFSISIICFHALYEISNRYNLIILVPIAYCACVTFSKLAKSNRIFALYVFLGTVPLILAADRKDKFNFDVDLTYRYLVLNHKNFMDYIYHTNLFKKRIYANYPLFESTLDPRYGYVQHSYNFTDEFDERTEYVAISNMEIEKFNYPPKEKLVLLKKFKLQRSVIIFYKVNHNHK